jgi:hypothetical protein
MDAMNTLSRYAERRDALRRHMGRASRSAAATARMRVATAVPLRFDGYFFTT